MFVKYRRPASVKQARVFVGAPIKVYWKPKPGSDFAEGWYSATVSVVHRVPEEGADRLFFLIQ